ncbi:hypothetical protein J1614_001109 [Plenodomus biglobosus]|nr:hypothetical protein J1614_001109 [Plenodomus biglobosus]
MASIGYSYLPVGKLEQQGYSRLLVRYQYRLQINEVTVVGNRAEAMSDITDQRYTLAMIRLRALQVSNCAPQSTMSTLAFAPPISNSKINCEITSPVTQPTLSISSSLARSSIPEEAYARRRSVNIVCVKVNASPELCAGTVVKAVSGLSNKLVAVSFSFPVRWTAKWSREIIFFLPVCALLQIKPWAEDSPRESVHVDRLRLDNPKYQE